MEELILHIESTISQKIISHHALQGGDISAVYKFVSRSQSYVLKTSDQRDAYNMFRAEAAALKIIGECKSDIKTPKVYGHGKLNKQAYLLLEYITPKTKPTASDYNRFGSALADMHSHTADLYGSDEDNYIGSLHQSNGWYDDWVVFYTEQRLAPQIRKGFGQGLLSHHDIPSIDTIYQVLSKNISCQQPSLLHGDLWSGNFIIASDGSPYVIDPSHYFGDAMVDIAMSKLFGGFPEEFYRGYFSKRGTPLDHDYLLHVYQAYYLLVHLNMFGASYKQKCLETLNYIVKSL